MTTTTNETRDPEAVAVRHAIRRGAEVVRSRPFRYQIGRGLYGWIVTTECDWRWVATLPEAVALAGELKSEYEKGEA